MLAPVVPGGGRPAAHREAPARLGRARGRRGPHRGRPGGAHARASAGRASGSRSWKGRKRSRPTSRSAATGRCPGWASALRVRTAGGFAVVSDTVEDAEVEGLVRRFAAWAAQRGGRGLFNVQVLRRGEARFVSDVNPRLGHVGRALAGERLQPGRSCSAPRRGSRPPGAGGRGAAGARAHRPVPGRRSSCRQGRRGRGGGGGRLRPRRHAHPHEALHARAPRARPRVVPGGAGEGPRAPARACGSSRRARETA